ncbi:hypothetical protein EYF80_016021 [Liparis tanakae]|uniref:Uncharacterized protein n=1 Tax=Liparis tanakae TaxID=230148 RepID=A0A4Z2I9L3_9TELE|nr:hypothetical protein EYF80_016021 [Liparis tanakae]
MVSVSPDSWMQRCSSSSTLSFRSAFSLMRELHAALAFIVLQPVHELDLLQVLVVDLFPLGGQRLVARTVLLQVGHYLVPLLHQSLAVLTFQLQLEQKGTKRTINTRMTQKTTAYSHTPTKPPHSLMALKAAALHYPGPPSPGTTTLEEEEEEEEETDDSYQI